MSLHNKCKLVGISLKCILMQVIKNEGIKSDTFGFQ